ncbi:MAG: OmpA family protein [Pseudomonadota bacterium]
MVRKLIVPAVAAALTVAATQSATANDTPVAGEVARLVQSDTLNVQNTASFRSALGGYAAAFERSVNEEVFFEAGSTSLSPSARAALDAQAEWLTAHPLARVTVTGFIDASNTSETDATLGLERARAVAEYLHAAGVSANQIMSIESARIASASLSQDGEVPADTRRAVSRIVDLFAGAWIYGNNTLASINMREDKGDRVSSDNTTFASIDRVVIDETPDAVSEDTGSDDTASDDTGSDETVSDDTTADVSDEVVDEKGGKDA